MRALAADPQSGCSYDQLLRRARERRSLAAVTNQGPGLQGKQALTLDGREKRDAHEFAPYVVVS